MAYKTHVGSLQSYKKGMIELDDDLRKYAFSNVFEVAGKAAPFERVAVAQNLRIRRRGGAGRGRSPWYAAPHDEFAIVMDGEVTFNFVKLADDQVPSHGGGRGAARRPSPTGRDGQGAPRGAATRCCCRRAPPTS